MKRTRFRESFIVPSCICPGARHITSVDQFVDLFIGVKVITKHPTIVLRITIIMAIDGKDATISLSCLPISERVPMIKKEKNTGTYRCNANVPSLMCERNGSADENTFDLPLGVLCRVSPPLP